MALSICMATYNGGRFVKEQMLSIINQLSIDDEVIVVDDCSTDNTIQILKEINDSRIKIFLNETNKGHVYSFNRTISLANEDFIIMSDQDDIWIPNRVELILNRLKDMGPLLVSTNLEFIDTLGKEIPSNIEKLKTTDSKKNLQNILGIFIAKKNYFGCTMGFRKELRQLILPIPGFVESHDLWIALAANLVRSNFHIEASSLKRRIHPNNASLKKRRLFPKIKSRVIFLMSIIVLLQRYYSNKLKRLSK